MSETPQEPEATSNVNIIGVGIIGITVNLAGIVCLVVTYLMRHSLLHLNFLEAMIVWFVAQMIVYFAMVLAI